MTAKWQITRVSDGGGSAGLNSVKGELDLLSARGRGRILTRRSPEFVDVSIVWAISACRSVGTAGPVALAGAAIGSPLGNE